ncbi:MAG: aminoglycoside phosphotransferase family protein [Ktedonobacteraceae bacterium]|nr:aminoglycoside phosphotransferase family protein [Ktedonobacteraceae bacterium]
MPDFRPLVDHDQILTLLRQHFRAPITDLAPVEGGQVARVFSFRTGEQAYILRFNTDNLGSNFAKELYLSRIIVSPHIPIAPTLHVGHLGNLQFAISARMPGQLLEQLPLSEVKLLLPELMSILDAIHHVDVRTTTGYGIFNDQGVGCSASWRTYLCQVSEEEDEGFYGKWYHLFEETFLERDLFERLYQQMLRLLDASPTERYLVHGDYSFHNMLAQDGKITAILDWIGAKYGDFVYDIAWLDFWSPGLQVHKQFQEYYHQRQVIVPSYAERMLCYQCYIALDAMRFFAKRKEENAYVWVREHILQKIDVSTV